MVRTWNPRGGAVQQIGHFSKRSQASAFATKKNKTARKLSYYSSKSGTGFTVKIHKKTMTRKGYPKRK